MSEALAKNPTTTRLEAYSDGVIAIIVTLMVLELKLPGDILDKHSLAAIVVELAPKFLAYVASFTIISISLLTHHTLMREAPFATTGLFWWNAHLLFWLSLIPFTTAAVGERPYEPFAAALFAAVFFFVGIAFTFLHRYVARLAVENGIQPRHSGAATKMDAVSALVYLAAIPLAWLSPYVTYILIACVAAAYFLPIYGSSTKG
jgi:uncharacterized membrane protein